MLQRLIPIPISLSIFLTRVELRTKEPRSYSSPFPLGPTEEAVEGPETAGATQLGAFRIRRGVVNKTGDLRYRGTLGLLRLERDFFLLSASNVYKSTHRRAYLLFRTAVYADVSGYCPGSRRIIGERIG